MARRWRTDGEFEKMKKKIQDKEKTQDGDAKREEACSEELFVYSACVRCTQIFQRYSL